MNSQERRWCGFLLKAARLKNDWSQESVCSGICSVSYLSKIETGQVEGSKEILDLLAARLHVALPGGGPEDLKEERRIFQLLASGQFEMAEKAWCNFYPRASRSWQQSIHGILLEGVFAADKETGSDHPDFAPSLERILDESQLALYFLGCGRYEEAILYARQGWIVTHSVHHLYRCGFSESLLLEALEKASRMAWDEGHPWLMGTNSALQGMICSNMNESGMRQKALHFFEQAHNIFSALNDSDSIDEISYNIACTILEEGRFEEAREILSTIRHPSVMDQLKLAVCYEQLGRFREALDILEMLFDFPLDHWDRSLIEAIASMTKIRLEDANYLKNAEYGRRLLSVFNSLQNVPTLHKGFAQFYLPWVAEWYKASREYAKLVDLYENFPAKPSFKPIERKFNR